MDIMLAEYRRGVKQFAMVTSPIYNRGMSENTVPTLPILNKVDLLKGNPYFQGLSPTELEIVVGMAIEEKYGRDAIILSECDRNRKLFFVASGAVKIFTTSADGKEQIIALSRPGDSFNDVPAFDAGVTEGTAQTLTDVVLFTLNGRALLERSCQLGGLAANIIKRLSGRIRELGNLVNDLSFRPVAGRLARIILDLAKNEHSPYLTQKDLAAMVGTAREVVARALKTLENDDVIRVERHRIVVVDRAALERMIE